jgi:hypothetical protein
MASSIAMDIDVPSCSSFPSKLFYQGCKYTVIDIFDLVDIFKVEQGDLLVRSADCFLFALDSNLVRAAARCIPFDMSFSSIPGVADLRYDSATLRWIFAYLRCEEVTAIENLHFSQLKCIVDAAKEFQLYALWPLCRLALRCALFIPC